MSSSFVYGYGFETANIYFGETLMFIRNHRDSFKKILPARKSRYADTFLEMLDKMKNEDFMHIQNIDDISTDMYDVIGEIYTENPVVMDPDASTNYLLDIVAAIIETETGISFEYQPGQSDEGCVGSAAIIMPRCYPWEYNEIEKNLTIEKLENILTPYVKEFNMDPKEITDIEIEYFG